MRSMLFLCVLPVISDKGEMDVMSGGETLLLLLLFAVDVLRLKFNTLPVMKIIFSYL